MDLKELTGVDVDGRSSAIGAFVVGLLAVLKSWLGRRKEDADNAATYALAFQNQAKIWESLIDQLQEENKRLAARIEALEAEIKTLKGDRKR